MSHIDYKNGEIIISSLSKQPPHTEKREGEYAASAYHYQEIKSWLRAETGDEITDDARDYFQIDFSIRESSSGHSLFDFQKEALERWVENGHRGIISLPTGAGKTYIACHAIQETDLATLFLTTEALVDSTSQVLMDIFDQGVQKTHTRIEDPSPLVVTTAEAAVSSLPEIGTKYGLIVIDECHQLKSNQNLNRVLTSTIAPCRLGLSSEKQSGLEAIQSVNDVIGPVVYASNLEDITGKLTTFSKGEGVSIHLRNEIEGEERLIQEGQYNATIIRQSAFFEELLESYILHELENIHGRELTNSQERVVSRLGHKNRIRLAYTIGAIDEQEYNALLEMASARNTLAHNSWERITQQEIQAKKIAERTLSVLKNQLSY